MVGYELSEDNGLIEAHEMVELLSSCRLRALSREFYPSEDRVGDVYRNFIERLTATFKSRLAVLQYIPGSFDVREATEMLDSENNSAIEEDTLRTLRQRSFLSYDSGKNRFSIQGIIRECLEVYCHIKNLPDIRKRYCKLFSVVLEKLCTDFYSSEYASAVSMFMLEQPNLQKLLIEVNHSKEDTYQYFMQVAASCTEFLDKFLTTESEKFYDGCLALASSYGKTKDMATVYIAIGSMYTNAKGEYATGEQNYRKALQHIARDDVTVQNATVHQRLGWNLYKRGNYMKAYKCLMQAYKTEKSLKMYNTSLRRQTLNSLGLVCADLGQFEEARRFLEENLQYLKTVGNQHWSLGCNYDNFGTLYELKGDDESAMKYYKKALKIKVSTTATNLSVVISLTNIANIYMKMDELPKAAEFSDRAMVKVRESQFPNKEALSLAYNTLGKVCLASGDFQKACELLEQAVEIRELNSPGGEFHIESLILLAKAKYKLHRYNDAIRNLKTVLDFRERFKKLYPSKFHIVECLENLYTIYEEIGESDSVIIILEDLQVELMRLERVFMCTSDDRRKQTIDVKLQYLKQYFMSFQCQKLQISNVSNSGKCS